MPEFLNNPIAIAIASALATTLASALAAWLLRPRLRSWAAKMPEDRRRDVIEVADRVHDFLEGVKNARPGGVEDIGVVFVDTLVATFRNEFGREPTPEELNIARQRATNRHRAKGGSIQLRGAGMEVH